MNSMVVITYSNNEESCAIYTGDGGTSLAVNVGPNNWYVAHFSSNSMNEYSSLTFIIKWAKKIQLEYQRKQLEITYRNKK